MAAQTGGPLSGLEPRPVWEFFTGIAAVPRPSKREQRIREHVQTVAGRRGLCVHTDGAGNLVIDVPPTRGFADAPILVLQAHLDMVCEKNASTRHDFEHEGIRMVVEIEPATGEQIVRGEGTTLGADNGIGVALALAAATAADIAHGPLELLFTVDEEDGMSGAKAVQRESLRGRRMLNLDSEEDDALYIGCAGGCDTDFAWTFDARGTAAGAECCRVEVSGLRGGHSGVDIHERRANAIKLLVRTLLGAKAAGLQLAEIGGGSKRNAIPREATAVVLGPAGLAAALALAAAEVARQSREETSEPAAIRVEKLGGVVPSTCISSEDTARLLAALAEIPSGVLGMHPRVPGLVETSNNLSTVSSRVDGSQVLVRAGTLSRSSSAERMEETLARLASLGKSASATTSNANEYPGWSPNPDSPTLAVCRGVYQDLFGKEPRIAAIHAGLECGIIGERVGGMDTVSLGPTIRGAHSPEERVYVASVQRTWRYLSALLPALAKR